MRMMCTGALKSWQSKYTAKTHADIFFFSLRRTFQEFKLNPVNPTPFPNIDIYLSLKLTPNLNQKSSLNPKDEWFTYGNHLSIQI